MKNAPIPTGTIRGKLKILYRLHNYKSSTCLCECQNCGVLAIVPLNRLLPGNIKKHIKQCVHCYNGKVRHHMKGTRIYNIWIGMKNRANNHDGTRPTYASIDVDTAWCDNFLTFYNWAMKNGYNDNLTLDRIDNNKGYSPDNCRFVDMIIQANNKSNNIMINGMSLRRYCILNNLKYGTVYRRIHNYGWSIDEAIRKE